MHLKGVDFRIFKGLYTGWRIFHQSLMEWDIRAELVSREMTQTLPLLILVFGVNFCL